MNVEITGLSRQFGRTMAVSGVDLRAGPGVFGLLGPNGAGKTSLLRMMATAIPPTSGRLRLLGRENQRDGAADRLAHQMKGVGTGVIGDRLDIADIGRERDRRGRIVQR